MAPRYRLTDVETVLEEGSWLFTASDGGEDIEVVLVPCRGDDEAPVEAWVNRCTHETQRLSREGIGAIVRDGGIVCPKHGSVFDSCSGDCGNGPAAGSTLRGIDIAIEGGEVYLTDDDVRYRHDGPSDDDGDDPASSSHLRF